MAKPSPDFMARSNHIHQTNLHGRCAAYQRTRIDHILVWGPPFSHNLARTSACATLFAQVAEYSLRGRVIRALYSNSSACRKLSQTPAHIDASFPRDVLAPCPDVCSSCIEFLNRFLLVGLPETLSPDTRCLRSLCCLKGAATHISSPT